MGEKTLVVIAGPTGSGKTALALRLAALLHTEIISADSRQIFRELNIGTAKPTEAELRAVPHHFINSHSIHDPFDAADFGAAARQVAEELFRRHDHVIVCGGSGLYLRAMLEGLDAMPEVDPSVREQIQSAYDQNGLSWLQEQVATADPDYYATVDRMNPRRLMRALEVTRASGKPYSSFRNRNEITLPYRTIQIGLMPDKETLLRRLDERMDEMIAAGLFEEAKSLHSLAHLNALQTVGYREIFGYLDNLYDRDEAVRLLKHNTRQYAKRQLTWFRKQMDLRWFSPDNWQGIQKYIESPDP